jgi:hypothetical protein
MKQSSWIAPLCAALLCITCGCDSGELRGHEEDLTAYAADMERLCAGVLQGTVQDVSGDNDAVTYVPCEHDGEPYRLAIEMVSEMHCMGSEDEPGVDCTQAADGSIDLSGRLEIGDDFQLDVTGHARVSMGKGPGPLECVYEPHDDAVPRSSFDVRPEGMFSDQEDLEHIDWQRRHSAENEEPTVWEVCHLPIESHE